MITHSLLRSSTLFVSLTLLAIPAFAAVKDDLVQNYAQVPLHFEANQGQAREDVQFVAHGPGYGVYLTANEALLALSSDSPQDCKAAAATAERGRLLRMSLLGGAKAPAVHAVDEQPSKANYFVGADSSKWRTNVPTYAKVRYDTVYPGIDLVYYGTQRQLEYDFVLAPGADPKNIELQFDGADRVEIDANGDLVLHACGREIRQPKPVVYQETDGRHEIAGRYVHKGKNRIGFAVAAYDRRLPLVIDPMVLSYGTYLGGTGHDFGKAIAVDAHGAAYVTGDAGANLPTSAGAFQTTFGGGGGGEFGEIIPEDAFVAKFNADGSLAYLTYLGTRGNENGYGIAVDSAGAAYVVGTTDLPSTFPTTPGAFRDSSSFSSGYRSGSFATKLDPTGSALVYSTMLNDDSAYDVAVDPTGNAYIAARTRSPGFPTTPSAFQYPGADLFVIKLNATGSALVYSSGFGTEGGSTPDMSIALDGDDNVYVTGTTSNAYFPVTAGAFQTELRGQSDPYVTKLGPGGELVYSTYLGVLAANQSQSRIKIAVDTGRNAYVTGWIPSTDFPTTAGAYRTTPGSGFVTKLNASGSGLVYSTYLAGAGADITVDARGRAYVAGGEDVLVTAIDPSGSAVSVSGIGASSAAGIALDPGEQNVWVVGSAGRDFPVTPNAFQPRFVQGTQPYYADVVVAKLATDLKLVPGTIQAEDFNQGGEGPGYHDLTPGNQGDAGSRTGEDVDIFISNDAAEGSPYIIKNFESGEWLAYTIDVPADGNYSIELRAATNFDFPNSSYYADIDGVNVTGIVVLPDTGGWDHYQWVGKRTVALTAGIHELKIVAEAPYFAFNAINIATAIVSTPYFNAPASIPGEIEAETFDAGGEGPGYHETTPGNQGDAYFRTGEDVDVFASNDTGSGSWYVVKNFEAGEWLAYTINVPTAGEYNIELRAATSAEFPNPSYYADIDGRNVTGGVVVLPDTGGFDHYQWIGKKTVTLPAGIHVLWLVAETPYFALNTIRVTPTIVPVSRAYFGAPIAVPGAFEAESFDKGGEGVGYHDNTPFNEGNSGYRNVNDNFGTSGPDIFVTNDATSGSPYIVKNFEAGEWLSYTINVTAGGNYDVELRAATNFDFPNSGYHLEVDGTNVSGPVVLPDTGGWDNYRWVGKRTIPLPAGVHVLTVVVDTPYFGFNSLRVLQSSP